MNKTDTFYMEIKRNREYLQLEQCYIAKLMSKHTGINFTIDEVGKIVSNAKGKVIMIDHHQQPDDFADYMISDTSSCSTAEMVYEFIENLGDKDIIDGDIGEALYCGIMTDTGSFKFPLGKSSPTIFL